MDSDLEAFSHNPTHGSFAPLDIYCCNPVYVWDNIRKP
jgi:hypothetical protein